jgi:hypothetical protein
MSAKCQEQTNLGANFFCVCGTPQMRFSTVTAQYWVFDYFDLSMCLINGDGHGMDADNSVASIFLCPWLFEYRLLRMNLWGNIPSLETYLNDALVTGWELRP